MRGRGVSGAVIPLVVLLGCGNDVGKPDPGRVTLHRLNKTEWQLPRPHFVFRVEIDPRPTSIAVHPVSGFELASRLSYFLWSSMPDDQLLDAAEAGMLASDEALRAHATRMLEDPRAGTLTDNFAGQWLFTRALPDQVPDYATYPDYDAQLQTAMRAETERYFRAFLDEDIPMDQFLIADFTYVNDRLATHYGLPMPGTNDLVKVSLAPTPRRGILTHGSVLTVTSHPRRTSPVKRGKWLLDQILCEPPARKPPMGNLFVSLLRACGVPTDQFGDDGTGPLPGVLT